MVWGAIPHGEGSNLVIVDETMSRHRDIQILGDQMLPWERGVYRVKFAFVQDNAPPRLARDTWAFLDKHDVEVMDWQAMSPGINTIVHAWDQMSIVLCPIGPNRVKLSATGSE